MLPVLHACSTDSAIQVLSAEIDSMCSNRLDHSGKEERFAATGWDSHSKNAHYNIVRGSMASARKAMTSYWESPEHKSAILNKDRTKGGVGHYQCPDGKIYHGAIFG
jgi:uncharacterized protein YkwD